MNKSSKNSLAHTRWECKYHIVFAPKYRRQIIYRQIKADVGKIVRELCERNRNNRGRMLSGSYTHVGEDTAKIQCVGNNGIFEREKFSMIFDRHANLKYKYGNRNFWCRGYYVDIVGKNAKKIQEHIKNQLEEDKVNDRITLKEYIDPFTGKPADKSK